MPIYVADLCRQDPGTGGHVQDVRFVRKTEAKELVHQLFVADVVFVLREKKETSFSLAKITSQ